MAVPGSNGRLMVNGMPQGVEEVVATNYRLEDRLLEAEGKAEGEAEVMVELILAVAAAEEAVLVA